MKTITLKRRKLDKKDFVKRSAKEEDCSILIEEPTILLDEETGDIKVIYDLLDIDTSDVVKAVKDIRYVKGKRSRGLISQSRIIGYTPRNEIRQDYCSSTSLARESARNHAVIAGFALRLEEYYKRYNIAGYEKHLHLVEDSVKENWRIAGESIFTSGIVNKNNPLKYHYDTGNFSDVYSMMVVFKGGVEGGYLSLPEYDCKFYLPNNSIFMFDGQGIIHGVTPIKYTSQSGYRFSIVYYTLKRMWQCLEIEEEIKRVNEKKTVRERTRMNNPMTEEDRLLKEKNVKMLIDRKEKQ